ncbi:12-oxophytodienoate reductase, partial [Candidatus Poribacteria bacterium]|nr:12-oxophytodienoate reductase [Candidatus Poribacteria bacterium]
MKNAQEGDTLPLAFQPWEHGSLRLRNRIVMAPMTRRMAGEDGLVTGASAAYYRRRAEGEVGLIISEGTHVDSKHAPDVLTTPRIETPAQADAWARVADAVHEAGSAFAPQLWHTGRMARDPIGPSESVMPERKDRPSRPVRAMTHADMEQVRDAFANAAAAAKRIGCDAVELHGAHGYLLDSFLSPQANTRADEYGGTPDNRARFPLEVVRAVRL